MLAGTVVGWGILSPLAKARGWAPGPVGDWVTGSRGWTIWICLAAMLADALVDLGWFAVQTLRSSWREYRHGQSMDSGERLRHEHDPREVDSISGIQSDNPLLTRFWLAIGLLLSIAIAIPAVALPFGRFMPTYVTVFAIIISLPLCIMGVKAVGTTDHNPASGIAKICQLIVGRVIPRSKPHAKLINLVAGGIAEAGAVQSGFMMQNFKTGLLSGSSPDTQFFGQLIGSFIGAILASALYRLYSTVYNIPNDTFQVPSGYVWRAGAALSVGEGLPEKTPVFGIVVALLFGSFAAMRIALGKSKWSAFIPMGIPFSVGMYNAPSFTLVRAMGGLAQWYWTSRMQRSETSLMVFACGLVLGEGLASIINLMLEALSIPHI
ncbi:OPT oligopeptide transporter protein-domain-containing protein [Lophiotrema nucula]|uniref:OPT oligopeptide transporter protein-domain-containing protein n=1 Tax=Lophiotrema nucula TaxID=690887 RepID=A0A6A5YR64_9PLEO|nr:OPT oligopeptide transporter protein-domain-containing protein [Lophiotrema nucula]